MRVQGAAVAWEQVRSKQQETGSLGAAGATLGMLMLLQLLTGCTALGAWVYDDPSLTLRSVTLRPLPDSTTGADSLDLVFAGCNRNDYDLVGEAFETRIRVQGRDVGEGRRDQPYRLFTRDSAPVTVTLAMQEAWADGATELPVEVESELLVKMPSGEKRIAVIQKGTLVLSRGSVVFKGAQTRVCRPGISTLPSAFTQPVGRDRPEPIRTPGKTAGQPGDP